jgi:hypothetical protein
MANPTLTPVVTNRATGINLATAPQAANVAGDSWLNTGREMLYIKNGSGGSINLTEVLPATAVIDGIAPTPRVIAVGAAGVFILGPFPPGTYNDVNGFMNVTYSAITSVTVLVFYLGN